MQSATSPRASRTHHPARASGPQNKARESGGPRLTIPSGVTDTEIALGARKVRLTNLDKLFWPELGLTKRALLQYYADVAPVLLPHLSDRAMVMKRYPNGAYGKCFFMKRAPSPPATSSTFRWCRISHRCSGS
jgi:bifunctional non-homologous end joining protein LigD